MNLHSPSLREALPLVERLKRVALLWSESTGRTLGALATVVANHGSFFERLEQPGAGTTTASLEKFARFLVDPGSWPEGAVPDEACRFAHAVGISGGGCPLPTDIADEIIAVPEGPQGDRPISPPADHPSGRTPAPSRSQGDAGTPAAPDAERGLPSPEGDGVAGDQSESQANAGDEAEANVADVEPVSRPAAGRSAAATSEPMDVTAGETAPTPPPAAPVPLERKRPVCDSPEQARGGF